MDYKTVTSGDITIRYVEHPDDRWMAIVPTEDIILGPDHFIAKFHTEFRDNGETFVRTYQYSHRGPEDDEGRLTSIYRDVTGEYLTVEEFKKRREDELMLRMSN